MVKVLEGTYEEGKITLKSEMEGVKKAKVLVIVTDELKKGITDESFAKAIERLKRNNPFRKINDPVKWQREIRKDRELSHR